MLIVFLTVFVIFFSTCGFIKNKELKAWRERIDRLKIEKIHEVNLSQKRRMSRAASHTSNQNRLSAPADFGGNVGGDDDDDKETTALVYSEIEKPNPTHTSVAIMV